MVKVYFFDDNYHVYKRDKVWVVRKATAKRVSMVFFSKKSAVEYAIKLAKKKFYSRVIIHNKNMEVEKII